MRPDVHVLSDSAGCAGSHNSIANDAWATKISEVSDRMTFLDKYDIAGQPVRFHWHTFSGHTAHQIMREIQTLLGPTRPCDFKRRPLFMSMFNDIGWWKNDNEQTCLASATEVTEHAKQFKLSHRCSCGLGREQAWYRSCPNKANGTWDLIARKRTHIRPTFTSKILSCRTFLKGYLKSKKGKKTIHLHNTTQTKEIITLFLACNLLCTDAAVYD